MKTMQFACIVLLCLAATALVPRFALAGTNDRVPTPNSSASAAIPLSLVVPPSDCSQTLTGPKSDDYEHEASTFPSPSWFDYDDCLTPPLSSQRDFEAQERAAAPGPFDLSEYMIGDVAVTVIFPESSGSIDSQTETWASARRDTCLSEIASGLTWWENQEPRANLHFNVYTYGSRSTGYEPIGRPSTDDELWIGEIMAGLGFNSGAWLDQVGAMNGYVRDYYQTDWAFSIFVVDSYNDSDGAFTDAAFAYAWLGGPYSVLTYDNDGYGISNMDVVAAHESGHIFWATDEYDDVGEYSGYLNIHDNDGANCIMSGQVNWNLCSSTRGQLGWLDTDGDNILDPLDTVPNSTLQPYLPDPTSSDVLTYYGSVDDVPLPNNNPKPWSSRVAVSLNTITAVQYRIDNGSWYAASSVDGAFDEGEEEFTFTTPALPEGSHLVQTRAQNSAGNWESSYSSDTIVVETDPIVTISTTGLVLGYPAMVHYWQSGAAKTATTYGAWSSVVDRGSMVSIDNAVAVSSTERYSTNAVISWTANQITTYAVPYYHQFKPAISVVTAGTGHTDLSSTNFATLTRYRFGSAGTFNMFDVQSFNDWVDVGSTVSLPSTSSASTSTRRWCNSGATSWVINDATSKSAMYWEQLRVTVVPTGLDTSHPANLQVAQNGLSMNATASTSWSDWADVGTTLSITNPVVVSGTERYSTTDATSWTVSQTAMYTVDYARQYYLTVQSERGNPQGTGWHDQGSNVQFSVDSIVEESDGIRSVFVSWSGDSGVNSNSASTIMDGPKTVTAAWKEQCQLTVSVAPSDATSASGSGWYDKGENVDLLVPDLVDSGTGVRYVFANWNVNGSRVNARSIYVSLDTPQSAEATYITQYYLDVQSVRGNPRGSGWYTSGSEAAISVESPVGSIVRQVFVKWSGASSGYIRDLHITVDSPRTVTAEWRSDYTQLYILVAGILLVGLVAAAVIILVIRRQRHARPQFE